MQLAAASRVDGLLRGGFLHAHTDGRYAAIAASIWPRADASKLRWRARATLGWSTRLACCFRRLAGNTARRLRKHTGFPNLCVFKSACRSQTHARRVSAASRRRQHASRVLHPEASARRHCVLMRQPCAIPFPPPPGAAPASAAVENFFKFLENFICGGGAEMLECHGIPSLPTHFRSCFSSHLPPIALSECPSDPPPVPARSVRFPPAFFAGAFVLTFNPLPTSQPSRL